MPDRAVAPRAEHLEHLIAAPPAVASAPTVALPAAAPERKHPTLAIMAPIAPRGAIAPPPEAPSDDVGDDEARPFGAETQPIPATPPLGVAQLSVAQFGVAQFGVAPLGVPRVEDNHAASSAPGASGSSASSRPGHRPLPPPDVVTPIASAHATLAAAAALVGALLALHDKPAALWMLALAIVLGGGGALAYALVQDGRVSRWAGIPLPLSQVAVLAWAMALVGPRPAFLLFVPVMLVLAARTVGRAAASLVVAAVLALYLGFLALTLAGRFAPHLRLSDQAGAVVDAVVVTLGLLVTLAGILKLTAATSRAETNARAREYTARRWRALALRERGQVEEEADALHQALADALRRRAGHVAAEHVAAGHVAFADGPLSPLAATIHQADERLATLQRDREHVLHLEGAIRALTRSVERHWLGLPWTWPPPTSTPVDELIALLRTPRPHETRTNGQEDTAALDPIPALAVPDERPPTPTRGARRRGAAAHLRAVRPPADDRSPSS